MSPARPCQPESISIRHVVGVAWRIVASTPSSIRANATGSCAVCRSAITTCAPLTNGKNSSSTEMSNDNVVTDNNTSAADTPRSLANDDRKLDVLPCPTSTPLGRPVEPEV